MFAMRSAPVRMATVVLSTLTLTSTLLAFSTVSPAAPKAQAITAAKGERAVAVARTRKGSPYKWGADGPRRFDCSGLTRWTYKRLGKSLPHSSRMQRRKTRKVSRSNKRRGDLVFFHSSSGRIYHVGICAGRGYIWHSQYSGAKVRKEKVRSERVTFRRVR
jgi:cell wall-associated NlpC family hydrolase